MDYPKSVPSVGLVGGKFVDEDPLVGTPGSLIPAQWGNAVTDELLNVITSAGLVPNELLNNQLVAAITLIVGSTRPLASQAEAEAGTDNAKSMTPLRTQQAISKRAAIIGSSRNVRMSVTVASASATLTADEIFVKASLGGAAWLLPSFNKTLNLAVAGAGGMDTGAAPVSGYVSIYAIYNPTSGTSALLACAQATSNGNIYSGANMPVGYTASALVSSWPTNASGQLVVGIQHDRTVSRVPANAMSTSTIAGSYTSVSMSSVVPLNAISVGGTLQAVSTSTSSVSLQVAADANGVGYQSVTGVSQNSFANTNNFSLDFVTAQTAFFMSASTAGTPTFVVSISRYSF